MNKYMKIYEENMKKAEDLSLQLLQNLRANNEDQIFAKINEINNLPVKIGSINDLKDYVLNNIEQIPLNSGKPQNICNFLLFIEKLEVEDFENYLPKIENKILKNINVYNEENLVLILYTLSKYRRFDKNVWNKIYDILIDKIHLLDMSHTSKLLLGLTMTTSMERNLITEDQASRIYTEIFKNIEKNINDIKYLDTFRILISLTKKPISLRNISEKVWLKLQQNFRENINYFDMYQISQIALLLCEIPYVDVAVYKVIEQEILKEYLTNIDEIIKNGGENMNASALLDDLSKISFALSISRQGSAYFWNSLIKAYIKHHTHISLLALENILFVCNRVNDFIQDPGINKKPELVTNVENLYRLIADRIKNEKLLEQGKIDPFNLMMPSARYIALTDETIWNNITKSILDVLQNKNFKANAFILTDIIMSYANYYIYLIQQTIETGKKFESNLFLQNFENFWKLVESHILTIKDNEFEIPNISNIVLDLSQIDIELTKSWGYLSDITRLKLEDFDKHNFILVVMGFSKSGIEDKQLWADLKGYVQKHLNEFRIEELKKIILAFINVKETGELWKEIEKRLASDDILSEITFDGFNDIQIPLALLAVNHEKIWQKFEELLFKNLNTLQNDKDLLLNTVYSFSRIGRGTTVLWNKLCTILKSQMLKYELEDQVHIIICLKPNVISRNSLVTIIDNDFWKSLMMSIEEKVSQANLNTCNNLLKALKENEYSAKNKLLIKKVEDRIAALLKRI
jgi:hypothetical protein